MPSISHDQSRHVTVDKRPGHYLSFPDICLTRTGRLVCVYRQAEAHVASRAVLLYSLSEDMGKTWGQPRFLNAGAGHCPRITQLEDGRLVVADDPPFLYWSLDHGQTFASQPYSGGPHSIPDRIMELSPNVFLSASHTHRGEHPQPKIRQPPAEQLTYISTDEGRVWRALSVLAHDPNLVLCEASMTRLADGSILALLRENSFVYEPMYFCLSHDQGRTWSYPRPTPLIGHRPCLGLTAQGKLLVTYRNVAPDSGTAAWLGDFEELDRDFMVHARRPSPANPVLTPDGLLVENGPGPEACVRYALRPMTDPELATAELNLEVLVEEAQDNACGVHFGIWWRLFPDSVVPDIEEATPLTVPRGQPLRLTLQYHRGEIRALINGTEAGLYRVDPRQADVRAILAGNTNLREENGGKHYWRAMSLDIQEPRYERHYTWRWEHGQGHPDAQAGSRVLELANDREANFGDFGYSGWTSLPDGRFLCAYHHGGSADPGYVPSRSSHIRTTWFTADDFTNI